MYHLAHRRFRPCDDRDSAALDRLPDEILTVESRALESAEDAPCRHLAVVDGKAGHFGITIDLGDIPQLQPVQSFFASCLCASWTNGSTSDMFGSRCMFGATPSIGAIRLTVRLTTGATFQPAVVKP